MTDENDMVIETEAKKVEEKKSNAGARNLVLMGILAIMIAVSTTSVSLAIYHNSGDIYLDRSRPGFLPDKEEIEEDENDDEKEEYDFSKSGVLTKEVVEEYLKNLQTEGEAIDEFEKPFDGQVLSDRHLGIVEEAPTNVNTEPVDAGVEAMNENGV
ncbi:MAG: hypothetical protein Q4A70_02580 [Candidatus Saccharibacteria bacterium]|nr:hypothetical protein [Candidatus Saccharibacteria bacterium]